MYISGEENEEQIAARAYRLGLPTTNVYLLCETDTDYCVETILSLSTPKLIIIDSIQTMRVSGTSTGKYIITITIIATIIIITITNPTTTTTTTTTGSTATGSVTHLKEACLRFVQLAKATGASVVLVGHVTKSGEVAGECSVVCVCVFVVEVPMITRREVKF